MEHSLNRLQSIILFLGSNSSRGICRFLMEPSPGRSSLDQIRREAMELGEAREDLEEQVEQEERVERVVLEESEESVETVESAETVVPQKRQSRQFKDKPMTTGSKIKKITGPFGSSKIIGNNPQLSLFTTNQEEEVRMRTRMPGTRYLSTRIPTSRTSQTLPRTLLHSSTAKSRLVNRSNFLFLARTSTIHRQCTCQFHPQTLIITYSPLRASMITIQTEMEPTPKLNTRTATSTISFSLARSKRITRGGELMNKAAAPQFRANRLHVISRKKTPKGKWTRFTKST